MAAPQYETIIIPKGTLLFRGINSTDTLTSDFAGMLKNGKYCLYDNYNVFFYPFPFISMTIDKYKHMCMHITTRDLTLVNLILPSKFNRSNKGRGIGGIKTCSKMKLNCDVKGHPYDPCVDYSIVPKEVAGMIGIAENDAETLAKHKAFFSDWTNKYFTTYKDSRGLIGVPEIVLHPLIEKVDKTEPITDFEAWYRANKSKFNYNYIHIFNNEEMSTSQELMDQFLSEKGLDLGDDEPYHLKINKKTGFFQIVELSSNLEELISPDFKSIKKSPDLMLSQKNIYKNFSDKYPKADTIPASLNAYVRSGDEVVINPDAKKWLKQFTDDPDNVNMVLIKTPGKKYRRILGYLINGKMYDFFLTPKGRDILTQEYNKDFKLRETRFENHPINAEVSAYLINPPNAGEDHAEVTNIPAPEINGLLVHYAKKKGLLGASRRRTLRRSRIPNLLKTR